MRDLVLGDFQALPEMGTTRHAYVREVRMNAPAHIPHPVGAIVPKWWNAERIGTLKELWAQGLRPSRIAERMGTTRAAIIGKSRVLNLHFHKRGPMRLATDHAAVAEGRTLFPSRVATPVRSVSVLKPGSDTRKLGHAATKGRWRGMPIYSLTLEERATCPRDCAVYRACYGNRMWMARRWQAGAELETQIEAELAILQRKHPRGFVIRLHLLGDFYSVEYVKLWQSWLNKFRALNVFGYTAWDTGTEIGLAVATLRNDRWDRFSVRTSGAKSGVRTFVVPKIEDAGEAILCPAQLNQTDSCATCGLCWHSKEPIAFLAH